MFGGEKRRVFAASNALDCDSDLPEDPVAFVRKILPGDRSRSRVLAGQLLSWKMVARARAFDVDLRPS
jgi:uridine phosphorylase